MLIEFRVKNFRSLRDEQTLSFVASTDKTLMASNTLATGVKAVPTLLRSMVIYGANASGKSNILKALQYMRGVVVESATTLRPGQTFSVQPFRLDEEFADQPSEFEITFIIEGVRYQYGFSLIAERVINEYLLVYKAFKPQTWFNRAFDNGTQQENYHFSSDFKGKKQILKGATRPNALFLSTAVQLNNEQLQPIFSWFANQVNIFNETNRIADSTSSLHLLYQVAAKKKICDFLTAADISIADIDITTKKVSAKAVRIDYMSDKVEIKPEELEQMQLHFHHTSEKGRAIFSLDDESSGTRNLLFLTGPVLEALNKGLILVIDELDASLHPLLVHKLVQLFQQETTNPYGAQLLFTTHDTSLLNASYLLRRDQVWFVEKNADQASALYSLADFSPRKNEALEKGYLQGRYGGVPLIDPELGEHRNE